MPSAESPGPSHAHTSDRELLGSEIGPLVAALGLDGVEEGYLTGPLVGQVLRMERRSARAQSRYSALRLTAILGGVAIPVLVAWPGPTAAAAAARVMAAVLGVTLAAASAVEGLLRFGER
ncbi:MAG: DUF4231 domain-containing protein, partial [Planctomycetaceae bacterium]|nr:DUF4231 domain-containing protein [Planctomycetaceae bacterium]